MLAGEDCSLNARADLEGLTPFQLELVYLAFCWISFHFEQRRLSIYPLIHDGVQPVVAVGGLSVKAWLRGKD